MLGAINITKDEYKEGSLGIMKYQITFFGLPVYTVKFTTTNKEIVGKLNTE
jgi:hypothetical protein